MLPHQGDGLVCGRVDRSHAQDASVPFEDSGVELLLRGVGEYGEPAAFESAGPGGLFTTACRADDDVA